MFTRRFILASPFVLRPLESLAADVDVVIVGAGAAGLAAASIFQNKGISYRLLEARSRVGGRCYTDFTLGAPVDLGAAYVHFAAKNPWTELAKTHSVNLEAISFNASRTKQLFEGTELTPEQLREQFLIFRDVREDIDEYEGKDTSLAAIAFKAQGQKGIESIRRTGHLALGEEPERVSINDYNTLWGGDNRAVEGGYGALLTKAYANLPVQFESVVNEIQEGRRLTIKTLKGEFTAKAALITAPIGVMQSNAIKLPSSATFNKALDGFIMGALSKVVFALKDNALLEKAGERVIDSHDKHINAFDIRPYGSNLLIASFGGDAARELSKGTAHSYMRERLVKIFGADFKSDNHTLSDWWQSPFSRGSYALVKPQYLASRKLIREPLRENVHYAGEATALEASMTVGGATLEGERVAKQIISALKL